MPFTSELPLSLAFEFLTFSSQEGLPPTLQRVFMQRVAKQVIQGRKRALSLDPNLHPEPQSPSIHPPPALLAPARYLPALSPRPYLQIKVSFLPLHGA